MTKLSHDSKKAPKTTEEIQELHDLIIEIQRVIEENEIQLPVEIHIEMMIVHDVLCWALGYDIPHIEIIRHNMKTFIEMMTILNKASKSAFVN